MRKGLYGLVIWGMAMAPFAWAAPKERAKEPAASAAVAVDFKEVEALARENRDFTIQVFRMAGQTCLNRNQPARAVLMYEQALKVAPSDFNLMEDLAEAEVAQKNSKEALATWEKVIAGRGDDVGTRLRYANFLDRAGEHGKAVEEMKALASRRPTEASLRYWISDAYVRQGKTAEAAKELQAMLKIFPAEESDIKRRLGLLEPKKEAPAPPKKEVKEVKRTKEVKKEKE